MDVAARHLADDLIGQLDADQRALLGELAGAPEGLVLGEERAAGLLARELVERMPGCLHLDDADNRLAFRSHAIAAIFADAIAAGATRHAVSEARRAYEGGEIVRAIELAQAEGDYDQALAWFEEAGGYFFIHFHGLPACQRILAGFPEDVIAASANLHLSLAMHALKSGNVSRARHLVRRQYGDDALDFELVMNDTARYPLMFREFRSLMAIYEDLPISSAGRARLADLLGEFELEDHLHRGAIYNTMLEIAIQDQDLDTAEELARRAQHHYALADAHLLVFYIELHRAVFSLMRGALPEADAAVTAAAAALDRVYFDTPTDRRLVGLLAAVIAYEKGDPGKLVRYLDEEFDKFAYGEVWPTIVELALYYGSLAISSQQGIAAARAFLDKWRVQEWRSRRFNIIITLRLVDVLQNRNRWQEAADLLTSVQARVNQTWVESAEDALTRLTDPKEIGVAMAWLRHLVRFEPAAPIRPRQVDALLLNDYVSARQRNVLTLWSAYLARSRRDITKARAQLTRALQDTARMSTVTHLVGEMEILNRLLDDKRLKPFAMASVGARSIVRRLETFAARGRQNDFAGLTRQEMRVLMMVAEGGTNKYVARRLRLSEVTVKFHLSNIYRKMGCSKRAEAIATARALNWVA